MRILLTNALNPNELVQTYFPGLGLAYIASYLEMHLPGNEIWIVSRDPQAALADFRPDIVGISSVTQNWPVAMRIASDARDSGAAVIVGGAHITSLPDQLGESMDVGVLGEGERVFADLVRSFNPHTRTFRDLHAVPGIVCHEGNGLVRTPRGRHIEPLDAIPFPARHLLELPRHGVIHVFSSRGCPYRCSFCFSSRFWGKPRYFSPEYVLKELTNIIEMYAPSRIYFYDDLFLLPKKRFRDMVRRIVDARLNTVVDFNLNCRANLIDDETAELLREMNVVTANFGFESASEETLRYLKGRSVTVQDNWQAVRTLRKHGIKVLGTFIIGSPQETRKQILETFEFIARSRLDFARTYILTPFPGTPIWRTAMERGLVTEPMDWTVLNQETNHGKEERIILSEVLSREDLYELLGRFRRLERRLRLMSWARSALARPSLILPFFARHASMALHRRRHPVS